jgi:TusA-related sulfurtransferase
LKRRIASAAGAFRGSDLSPPVSPTDGVRRVGTLKCDRFLDLRGLECPFPVVKAREEVARMLAGEVLKVLATEEGSLKNFQVWANTAKNVVLIAQGVDLSGNEVCYTHYLRKVM